MKTCIGLCAVLLAVAAASIPSFAADENVKPAVSAAERWLALLDAGQYGQCWDQADGFFQQKVTKEQWEEAMKTVRAPLGKMESRHLMGAEYKTDLPEAPPGKYVILQFQTKFANAPNMIETVTPMLEKDGQWRVSGWFIKAGQ